MEKTDGVKEVNTTLPGTDETVVKEINAIVAGLARTVFQGLVVAFDETGRVLYANDRYRLIVGVEGPQPEGRNFFDLIPEGERGAVVQMFRESKIRSFKKCFVPLSRGPYTIHHRVVPGELEGFSQGMVLKISDLVLSELKEIEIERVKALLAEFPNKGLWVTTTEGVIVDVLHANCRMNLGWDSRELIGRKLSDFTEGEAEGETHVVERRTHEGVKRVTEVVRGTSLFSDGREYVIYLDTYR